MDHIAGPFRGFLLEKERFCDRLELVADLLPNRVDANDCLLLAQNVVPLIKRAHVFEEQTVFPAVLVSPVVPLDMPKTIERLKFEHMGDEDYAEELCIALRSYATQRDSTNVDSLAWMLRGFFDGLRRHVAFERHFILPLIDQQDPGRRHR